MLRFAGDEAPPNSQPLDGAPTHRRGLRRLSPVAGRVRRGVARRATNGGTARRHARPVPKTTPARRDARETVPANAFEAAAGALRSTAPMLRGFPARALRLRRCTADRVGRDRAPLTPVSPEHKVPEVGLVTATSSTTSSGSASTRSVRRTASRIRRLPADRLQAATAPKRERSRRAIRRSRTVFDAPVLDRRFGSVAEHRTTNASLARRRRGARRGASAPIVRGSLLALNASHFYGARLERLAGEDDR